MPTYTLEQQQSTVQSWNADPYMYVGLDIWVIPAQPTRIHQQAGPLLVSVESLHGHSNLN